MRPDSKRTVENVDLVLHTIAAENQEGSRILK